MKTHQVGGLLVSGEPNRWKVETKCKRKKKVRCFKYGNWGHVKTECLGKEACANIAASVGDSEDDNNLL